MHNIHPAGQNLWRKISIKTNTKLSDNWGLVVSLVRLPVKWRSSGMHKGKSSRYTTNTKVNSAFHPFRISSINLSSGWGYGGARSPVSISYGRRRSIALRWVSYEELHHLTIVGVRRTHQNIRPRARNQPTLYYNTRRQWRTERSCLLATCLRYLHAMMLRTQMTCQYTPICNKCTKH